MISATNIARGELKGVPYRLIKNHKIPHIHRPTVTAPFKLDGGYCNVIFLNKGLVTIVDAADYEWLNQWRWGAKWNRGSRLFYATRQPAMVRRVKGPEIQMHRQIMGLTSGDRKTVDHRETSQTLDNRRSNLRIATYSEQSRNQRIYRTNQTGFKGVDFVVEKQLYRARIRVNYQEIHLGYRKTAKAAFEELRVPATHRLHGEFARVR